MKVLVADDDVHITAFLESHLPSRGFVVDVAHTGAAAIAAARTNEYDLILLDMNLPDMTGDEVVQSLQGKLEIPPILMLTVIADPSMKVRLLNAGADDYMVKPFLFDELIARMHALLRRSPQITPDSMKIGDIELDLRMQTVRKAGEPIILTRKEFALLAYLMRNQGIIVPKSTLIEHVWDSSSNAFSAAIETHMANLRRKLGSPNLIQTIHSRGYMIE